MDSQAESVNYPPAQQPKYLGIFTKNQLIIATAVILLVIIAVVAVAVSTNSTPQSATKEISKQKVSPTVTLKPTVPPVAPKDWQALKTQYYTVTVPTNWKPVTQPMQGGVSVVFQPANAPGDPILVVESFDTPISIPNKVKLFEAMGLVRKQFVYPNSQPVMVSGTWQTRTINGKTIHTPTQERIVFIPHGNSAFGVKMYYSSSEPVKVYDDVLEKVLSSFTIAKP